MFIGDPEDSTRPSSDSSLHNDILLSQLVYDKQLLINNPAMKSFCSDLYVEDGPLFRATIKQLESRTGMLKASLKRINKATMASYEVRQQLNKMDNQYMDVLRESHCTDLLMSQYLNNAWKIIREERVKLDYSMSTRLLDPLRHIYEDDIKTAENKKRMFEDESKEYYAYLAKYLKANKKKQETEDKQMARKRRFDLARFDYLTFLIDLHGGKKENEILTCLTEHTMKQYDYYQSIAERIEHEKTGLNELHSLLAETERDQKITATERALKRKELQSLCNSTLLNNSDVSLTEDPIGSSGEEAVNDHKWIHDIQRISMDRSVDPVQQANTEDTERNKFKGIRDLDQHTTKELTVGRKKEGFLFATSKPSKSTGFDVSSSTLNWHKYWCVLSNGQLYEYINWKKQLESHIDPINLRYATVREARNSERRFCFEVITPYMRRIYQATSQEECQSWIATIHNSIESMLIGNGSSVNLLEQVPVKKHGRSLSGALKTGLAVVGNAKDRLKRQSNTPAEGAELLVSATNPPDRFRWSNFSFGHSHNSKMASVLSNQPPPLPDSVMNDRLLSVLREDISNQYCADCGSKDPSWCSLNLGILLCIECSGIHRSLGTHISKIRSLTLDSNSYTPDIIELLKSVGNARSNAIWDCHSQDDIARPEATDSRDAKLVYIQAKYVHHSFVKEISPFDTPDHILHKAIQDDDIPNAVYAIALGANINTARREDDMSDFHLFMDTYTHTHKYDLVRYPLHYALLQGRTFQEDYDLSESESMSSSLESSSRRTIFPMAELLFQNGADTNIVDTQSGHTLGDLIGMSLIPDDAITYINLKNTARGQPMVIRTSMLTPTSTSETVKKTKNRNKVIIKSISFTK